MPMDPIRVPKDAGKQVLAFRVRRGWTQEELAHEIGVTVSTVNRWERRNTKPSRLAWIVLQPLLEGV